MTVPMDYAHASEIFERYLAAAIAESGLTTRHQVFAMTYAVFRVFRRRLDARQALRFADALPVALRGLFVEGLDVDARPAPFLDRRTMTREAQAIRRDHNLAPDDAIAAVGRALRAVVDSQAFDAALAALPDAATAFWRD